MNSGQSAKPIMIAAIALATLFFGYFAITHLGYFADVEFLGAILFLQLVIVALSRFDRIFFPILVIGFVWAGMNVPLQGAWTRARWALLGVGALFGFVFWLQRKHEPFRFFHLVAGLCIVSAFVSAMVSAIPSMALSKAASLFLLFLYCASGMRLAVRGREDQFFRGLVLTCEVVTYIAAFCYLVLGLRVLGNQNSLGAAIGVYVLPILFWAWLVAERGVLRRRRLIVLLISSFLVFFSMSRAAMIAVTVVSFVICVSLREYKILIRAAAAIACLIAAIGIFAPSKLDDSAAELTDAVVYKGHKDQGLLGSRQTPWEETVAEIKAHPFFGSGFGTSATEEDAAEHAGIFSSTSETNREHGSSYMEIAEWVGLLGLLPFVLLLAMIVANVRKVISGLRRTGNLHHYAVPLALVLLAGLVHATFEDWMFAVGSYACILFWSFAFVLVDFLPDAEPVRIPIPVTSPRFERGFAAPLRTQ